MRNIFKRPPDVIIGDTRNPYMLRWHIIPRNRVFNIYLHKFLRSDDDRALHDHPWASVGMILKGEYLEWMPLNPRRWREEGSRIGVSVLRKAWRPVFRRSTDIHRIELMKTRDRRLCGSDDCVIHAKEIPVWTIFITGPRIREWGFWCPFGFRNWREFTHERDNNSTVGKGCE